MPAKQIISDEAAQQALLRGINMVSDAVRLTLGPKGRNVVLEKKWGAPVITNDGVSIAKEVELPDSFENMGAQLIKEAASKTNDIAGDGTTTATVLAQVLVQQGMRNVAAGADPMAMKRGIDKCVEALVARLGAISNPIQGRDQIAQVASISANDREIGDMLADVLEKVGAEGVVTVEEGKGIESETEYVEGMNFDRGYISPLLRNQPGTHGIGNRPAPYPGHRQKDFLRGRVGAHTGTGVAGHQEPGGHSRRRGERSPRGDGPSTSCEAPSTAWR